MQEQRTETSKMTFSQALKHAREGRDVSRNGWNGKGMYIFEAFVDSVRPVTREPIDCPSTRVLCMRAADGSIVVGWLASQTDILAIDWGLVEGR